MEGDRIETCRGVRYRFFPGAKATGKATGPWRTVGACRYVRNRFFRKNMERRETWKAGDGEGSPAPVFAKGFTRLRRNTPWSREAPAETARYTLERRAQARNATLDDLAGRTKFKVGYRTGPVFALPRDVKLSSDGRAYPSAPVPFRVRRRGGDLHREAPVEAIGIRHERGERHVMIHRETDGSNLDILADSAGFGSDVGQTGLPADSVVPREWRGSKRRRKAVEAPRKPRRGPRDSRLGQCRRDSRRIGDAHGLTAPERSSVKGVVRLTMSAGGSPETAARANSRHKDSTPVPWPTGWPIEYGIHMARVGSAHDRESGFGRGETGKDNAGRIRTRAESGRPARHPCIDTDAIPRQFRAVTAIGRRRLTGHPGVTLWLSGQGREREGSGETREPRKRVRNARWRRFVCNSLT